MKQKLSSPLSGALSALLSFHSIKTGMPLVNGTTCPLQRAEAHHPSGGGVGGGAAPSRRRSWPTYGRFTRAGPFLAVGW